MVKNPWREIRRLSICLEHARAEADAYRMWHSGRCGCHDSRDKCNCASNGHPPTLDCGCCDLGLGLCGPLPIVTVWHLMIRGKTDD